MGLLDVSGILLAVAALLAWLNHKVLRLPTTIGLMLLALLHALGVLVVERFVAPGLGVEAWSQRLLDAVDFDKALMEGMLGFLLFAGALHVKLSDLKRQTVVVALLATAGVAVTTALVGGATFGVTQLLGVELPLIYCFIFGALIAPTDPIAVLAIMKKVGAPKTLETKLAGESLFNDGVGVVVFLAMLGVAGIGHGSGQHDATSPRPEAEPVASVINGAGAPPTPDADSPVRHEPHDGGRARSAADSAQTPYEDLLVFPPEWTLGPQQLEIMRRASATDSSAVESGSNHSVGQDQTDIGQTSISDVAELFAVEVLGGLGLGFALGLVAFALLWRIDDYKTEVLITLATVTGGYTLCTALHVSGPLAMVVAGLLLGNTGRAFAMSATTAEHLDTFWELVDEILNAVLFVLIGLEVLVVSLRGDFVLAGLCMVPLVLLARWLSVGGVVSVLRPGRDFTPHAVKVVTWAGLRGGISVALALSLTDAEHAARGATELIVTMTYVVVAFSILVQGLTVGPLLRKLRLAGVGEGFH